MKQFKDLKCILILNLFLEEIESGMKCSLNTPWLLLISYFLFLFFRSHTMHVEHTLIRHELIRFHGSKLY